MAETNIQRKLQTAIKNIQPAHPWSLLEKVIPYDANKYAYPIRTGTMPTSVKLYEAFIRAAIMYDDPELSGCRGYRLVRQKGIDGSTKTYLEARCDDDSSIIIGVHKEANGEYQLRASFDETDANGLVVVDSPVIPFKDMDTYILTCCCLALWPDILQIDSDEGSSRIRQACSDLITGLKAVPSSQWTSKNDIPDSVRESVYFLDAALSVMQNKMVIHCGNDNSDTPQEIESNWFNSITGKLVGGLLIEHIPDDWTPILVEANGTAARYGSSMTIADAKVGFSCYSADRNWTHAERQLIPQLPDDMPVMPEVIRIAKRIVNTMNDEIPAVNIMWRGETGFGKSTGMKQLACILNTPFLTMTCHSGMEAQEFKSQFVPASEPDDGIELEQDFLTVFSPQVPFMAGTEFTAAMSYVNSLDATAQKELFAEDNSFFELAIADQEEAETKLFGKSVGCDLSMLFSIYHRAGLELQKAQYENKLAQALASQNGDKAPAKSGPDFRHIVSPYIKAMVNGYIVEVQEPSRIRDSGVLVSLNEFDRPGSVMQMLNGKNAVRHKKAIYVVTDNVGYNSCRPLDPSVIRRFAMVIDSYDLPKDVLFDRAKRNTGVTEIRILETAHKLWLCVREFCQQNSISEGSVSPVEFERFVQAIRDDGMESIQQNLDECVIGKATSSVEDQRDIRTACMTLLSAT